MPKKFSLEILMTTCPERKSALAATLRSLGETDWSGALELVTDDRGGSPSNARMVRNFARAISLAASRAVHFVMLCEDDIIFNRHLEHNLQVWLQHFRPNDVGSLYRTSLSRTIGSQAIVATPQTWLRLAAVGQVDHPHDVWLRKSVAPKNFRIHRPSLVQHNDTRSTVGHPTHRAKDFDQEWRA